uniref:GPI inositol-deacylase n=1 Tax=Romanomermis culicivorax TaxID=13658 RepID=A0A915I5K2_ROMCU
MEPYVSVRSLASVSLVKSTKNSTFPLFNYFTVDLNEEFSAFSSMYLERQTKFVAVCIKKILAIYKRNTLFSKIAIIGHSQGGIIARYLLASKLIDPDSVNVIYELAAPILKPATTIDRTMVKMYDVINDFENENKIIQVSIGGGFNDLQVNEHLNNFPLNLSLQISTIASSLPQVWASTDHLCIVWCNQLVRLIVRSIFNIYLDTKTVASKSDISRILSYHFVNNDGLSDFLLAKSTERQSRTIKSSNALELSGRRNDQMENQQDELSHQLYSHHQALINKICTARS